MWLMVDGMAGWRKGHESQLLDTEPIVRNGAMGPL